MKHDKVLIQKIAEDIEKEYKMGGLSSGISLDFATDVAIRYANLLEFLGLVSPIDPEEKGIEPCPDWMTEEIKKDIKLQWQQKKFPGGRSSRAEAIKFVTKAGNTDTITAYNIIKTHCLK